jgi:hypothetical protein
MIPNLGLEIVNLGRGNVRRIGDDQVKRQTGGQRGKSIPAMENRPLLRAVPHGILTRDREGVGRKVHCVHPGMGKAMGKGDGQAATSGSKIKDLERLSVLVAHTVEGKFGEELGLGAGDQDATIDLEFEVMEEGGPQDVLERFASATALNQVPDGLQVRRGEDAIELQVEMQARNGESVCQQPLYLQPGRIHSFARQEFCAALDHFEHRHGYGLEFAFRS